MGDSMQDFNAGMRAFTGAPDPTKKKKNDSDEDDSVMNQASAMLNDAGSGVADMAGMASDYLFGKKKK